MLLHIKEGDNLCVVSCLQSQLVHGPFKRYSANLLKRQSLDESHGIVIWKAKAKSHDSLKRKLERVIGTLCFSLCCHCIYSFFFSFFFTVTVLNYCNNRIIEIYTIRLQKRYKWPILTVSTHQTSSTLYGNIDR